LVLHGIGGNTIEQAKRNITAREFASWVAYINKRGSLNYGMRSEYNTALLLATYANAQSKDGGYKIWDFMPHEKEPEISLNEAMKQW
jgi:hypothetical protein